MTDIIDKLPIGRQQAKLKKHLAEKPLLENGPIGAISFVDVHDAKTYGTSDDDQD